MNYISAVMGFYTYLHSSGLKPVNRAALDLIKKQRRQSSPSHLRLFDQDNIEAVIAYADQLNTRPAETPEERLCNLRDRALILTLADSGLRIHEACNLKRGDIDMKQGRAVIIGKGDKQAVVRFTARSIQTIRDYLHVRARLDGASGKQQGGLPLFLRHDLSINATQKTDQFNKLSTEAGREIVDLRVKESLGSDWVGTVTPHSFRHYFVTVILKATGNLRVTQELARHSSITTTTRYSHLNDSELDAAYRQALEPGRKLDQ